MFLYGYKYIAYRIFLIFFKFLFITLIITITIQCFNYIIIILAIKYPLLISQTFYYSVVNWLPLI
jgi:hypothetical protein